MFFNTKNWSALGVVTLFAGLAGCTAGGPGGTLPDDTRAGKDPIIDGSPATGYPEAALITFSKGATQYICSGSVIAPQVVLTAGHCVAGASNWSVKAPFANGQASNATGAATYDYKVNSESVDPNAHDVALIFLAAPIKLASYPTVASAPAAEGAAVTDIGRINNGVNSDNALYVSKPHAVSAKQAQSTGFPYDYQSTDAIQPGDSGGADVLAGTHTIVSVNSGVLNNGGGEVLARVDLVSQWIQDQIKAHSGGQQPPTNPPGGTQPPTNPPGGTPPPPNPGPGGGQSTGSYCYSLACNGASTGQKCFDSEEAYCAALSAEKTCADEAQFIASTLCN